MTNRPSRAAADTVACKTPAVLATDLDGTFLAGEQDSRQRLAAHFRSNHQAPERALIYVTGRSLRSVMRLINGGDLPQPDHIICDVGTTVARGDGELETAPFVASIAEQWSQVSAVLTRELRAISGLRPQHPDDVGPNRGGYYFDQSTDIDSAVALVEQAGADVIMSDGTFFDVLPRGVNKGSTLLAGCEAWGIDPDSVMVAGDTLNDLAMLTAGFRAVVVGNAEPALLEAIEAHAAPRGRVHVAQRPGCDGIVEALEHIGVSI